MYKEALLKDKTLFLRDKKIALKRPSEYWLLFFKKYILVDQPKKFQLRSLFFLLPVIILLLMIFGAISLDNFGFLFFAVFIAVIGFTISGSFVKYPFVDVYSFNHLAKFIIDAKGDVFKNVMNIQLNLTPIENELNFIEPKKIGLTQRKGVVYKPYELERYKALFTLNNGATCIASLHQIALKVKTTKRRSSGKTKTKYKYKHKFLYTLSLKINTQKASIKTQDSYYNSISNYTISAYTEDEFHYIKVKLKDKKQRISDKLADTAKNEKSHFTKMVTYLLTNNILVPNQTPNLPQN